MKKIIVLIFAIVILIPIAANTVGKQSPVASIHNIDDNSDILVPLETYEATVDTITSITRVDNAKLIPNDDIELSFLTSGTVEKIVVSEGDILTGEELLMELDTTNLELTIEKTKNLLTQKKATLEKLIRGERAEEIQVLEDKKVAAKTSLHYNETILLLELRDAYVIGNEIIRNRVDQLFTKTHQPYPNLLIHVSDSKLRKKVEDGRADMEDMLDDWKIYTKDVSTTTLAENTKHIQEYIAKTQYFTDLMIQALNEPPNDNISLESETLLFDAQNNLQTLLTQIENYTAEVEQSRDLLTIAESNLIAKKAAARYEDISIAEEIIKETNNQILINHDLIKKSSLLVPAGRNVKVKKLHFEEGETTLAGQPAVLLASMDLKLQIDIPEEDIGWVTDGAPVEIILKSYPETSLYGEIIAIEEQEIVKSGSTYFRAHAQLVTENSTYPQLFLRSGMTGDVFISTTDSREVLMIPKSAIYHANGIDMVKVIEKGEIIETPVTVGSFDSVYTEIVNGISEGQKVVRFP